MPQNDIPVIKLSGKALENKAALKALFSAVKDKKVIFVHGGGVEVDALLKQLNLKTEKIDGIRVSPPEQMPYITAALAGLCNRYLQADAKACGLNALGLIATDGDSVTLSAFDKKFGNVATALPANGKFISLLLENKITPTTVIDHHIKWSNFVDPEELYGIKRVPRSLDCKLRAHINSLNFV